MVKFRSTSPWPMLRVAEYAHKKELELIGLSREESEALEKLMNGCSVHHDSRYVTIKKVTVDSLSALMKALDLIARNSASIVGSENSLKCAAQARATRIRVLEIKTRLDLTGSTQ